jgi:chromosome segregation ATPase
LQWAKSIYDKDPFTFIEDDDGSDDEKPDEDDNNNEPKKKDDKKDGNDKKPPESKPDDKKKEDKQPPDNKKKDEPMQGAAAETSDDDDERWEIYEENDPNDETFEMLAEYYNDKEKKYDKTIEELDQKLKDQKHLSEAGRASMKAWVIDTMRHVETALDNDEEVRRAMDLVSDLKNDMKNDMDNLFGNDTSVKKFKDKVEEKIKNLESVKQEILQTLSAQMKLEYTGALVAVPELKAKIKNLDSSISYLKGSLQLYEATLSSNNKVTKSREEIERTKMQMEEFGYKLMQVKKKEKQYIADLDEVKNALEKELTDNSNLVQNTKAQVKAINDATEKQTKLAKELHQKKIDEMNKEIDKVQGATRDQLKQKLLELTEKDPDFAYIKKAEEYKAAYDDLDKHLVEMVELNKRLKFQNDQLQKTQHSVGQSIKGDMEKLRQQKTQAEEKLAKQETEISKLKMENNTLYHQKQQQMQVMPPSLYPALPPQEPRRPLYPQIEAAPVETPEQTLRNLVGILLNKSVSMTYAQNLDAYNDAISELSSNAPSIIWNLYNKLIDRDQVKDLVVTIEGMMMQIRMDARARGKEIR